MPTTARCSPRRSTTGCSLLEKRARPISSRPPTAPISAASAPPKPPSPAYRSLRGRKSRPLVEGEDADRRIIEPDRADRSWGDFDPRIKIERHSEREQQRRADHIPVADDQHGRARMNPAQLEKRVDDPVLDLAPALASGNGGDAAVVSPQLPTPVVADRIECQPGPFGV